jgi:hypothetical protein
MRNNTLISFLTTLILLACLPGVQGQYATPSSSYSSIMPSGAQDASQYAQFYSMNSGQAPSTHIGSPQQFEISGKMPSTVYFSNQMQPVPYSQYVTNPTYMGANSLWIKGATDWTQYAVVPMGSVVQLLAIAPSSGSGTLSFVDSNGLTYSYNYFFFPNSLLTFYADIPGRHSLSFSINGKVSNQVLIDVTGTYVPNNYLPPTNYYPGYYSGSYSPWDYGNNVPSTPVVNTPGTQSGGDKGVGGNTGGDNGAGGNTGGDKGVGGNTGGDNGAVGNTGGDKGVGGKNSKQ